MAAHRLIPGRKEASGLKLHRPIAIIDLETTGTFIETDRIVEVGILKVLPNGKTLRFRKRVRPGIKIPREATRVHGIKNQDVAHKPRFKTIVRKVEKFIRGCDLAGFNLKSFDLLMLQAEFERARMELSWDDRHVIDVKEIYHHHETRTLTDAVRFYCQGKHDEAHSALEDAVATWQVLGAQIERYGLPRSVRKLAEFMQEAHSSKYLDSGRWFILRDSKPVLVKGKYKGIPLPEVATEEPDYLQWMLGLPDVPTDTKEMIRKVLED